MGRPLVSRSAALRTMMSCGAKHARCGVDRPRATGWQDRLVPEDFEEPSLASGL